MSNPINDLWDHALGVYHDVITWFNRSWASLDDVAQLPDWERNVKQMIYYLTQLLEVTDVLASSAISDAMSSGRDATAGTIMNFRTLRWPILPRYLELAEQWADGVALSRAQQAIAYAVAIVQVEALRREHADEVEGQDRILGDQLTAAQAAAEVKQEHDNRVQQVNAAVQQLTAAIAQSQQFVLAQLAQAVQVLSGRIAQVLAYAQSIPGQIDKTASAAYDATLQDRASGFQRLLDTAAAHDPLIADLVTRLAGYLTDLAEIDDPLIRIAAQLVLKQVIDHLGLDTALGALLNGILGAAFGQGPPRTLADVETSTGNRLNALEAGEAALSPLADEADRLHEMGTLPFDAALLAYLAAAVADPVAAADDTANALEPVIGPLLAPVRGLLGMP